MKTTARILCCASISVFLLGGKWAAAPGAAGPAQALMGRAIGPTPLMEDLRELCDRIGGRPTGSPACERAIAWGAAKFKTAGIDSVSLEAFNVPSLWLGETAEASCVAPETFPIRIAAAPYSPSTPGGKAIEARLVDAGIGTEADFAKLGAVAKGAIVLIHNPEMKSLEDLFGEYLSNSQRIDSARKSGALAVLLQSTRPRGLLYRHPASLVAQMTPMPIAIVSREHALRLARLCSESEVRVRVAVANRTGGVYESRNVVAEIRGSERPEEIVLIGAHLDSWDLGTGAEDNGVNSAMIIDIARGFRQLGLVPRRTVRFVLFTGEEQGMWGSAGYAKRHEAELDGHVAAIVYDIGSGRTRGFYLDGREELRAPLDRALAAASGLSAGAHLIDGVDGTDNFDFLLYGVPNLVADQDATEYLPNYHAESDVFERVDAREAGVNAAIASVLVWELANASGPLARRQSREEVERLLAATHLDDQMKAFGQWEDWAAGRRGLPLVKH